MFETGHQINAAPTAATRARPSASSATPWTMIVFGARQPRWSSRASSTRSRASTPSPRCTMKGTSAAVRRHRCAISPPGSPRAPAGRCSRANECAQPYRRTIRIGIVRRSSVYLGLWCATVVTPASRFFRAPMNRRSVSGCCWPARIVGSSASRGRMSSIHSVAFA